MIGSNFFISTLNDIEKNKTENMHYIDCIDSDGCWNAKKKKMVEIAQILIEHGADVNSSDNDGQSKFLLADDISFLQFNV